MHNQLLRRLLLVDLSTELNCLVSDLQLAGWEVHVCSLDDAFEQHAEVGLIRLDTQLDDLDGVRDLISHNPALWIALLAPGALADSSLAALIGEWFFDYHTLPLDSARLQVTLGHALGMARLRRPERLRNEDDRLLGNTAVVRSPYGWCSMVSVPVRPSVINGMVSMCPPNASSGVNCIERTR